MDSPTPFPRENLSTTTTEFKHHVVMFPYMAQGHIIPFLELAKKLAKRTGFAITIANTPLNIRSLRPKIESAGPGLDIRLAELPFSGLGRSYPLLCFLRGLLQMKGAVLIFYIRATRKRQNLQGHVCSGLNPRSPPPCSSFLLEAKV